MRARKWASVLAFSLAATLPAHATRAEQACLPDPAGIALEATGAAAFTEDPSAGWWRTWLTPVNDVSVPQPDRIASREVADELVRLHQESERRTPERLAAIARWDAGGATHAWTSVLLDLVTDASLRPDKNPPRLSRDIAIVTTAMFDALAATWKAKLCYRRPAPWAADPTLSTAARRRPAPSYPSEHAAVAGVMYELAPALFGESVADLAYEAFESRLWAGVNFRSDLVAGFGIGTQVARNALAAREDDGSSAVWDGSGRLTTSACNWQPTPPAFQGTPVEPLWGRVRPWVMATSTQVRPSPPPSCDSEEYVAAARDVFEASRTLSERQKAIATYWAGGPGTETPPGMNLHVAMDATFDRGLTTMREARVLAYTGAVLADAAIAAWDSKFTYWWDRPVTTIRRMWDAAWTSYIGTPPFPGYVSGHSTFSGSAMALLAGFFPEDAVRFRALATEAAMSRFYGGIHARYDNETGLDVGASIAALALARAATDGAG